MQELNREIGVLNKKIASCDNTIHGIERLLEQYMKNPSFGDPETVYADLYAARSEARNHSLQVQRLQAMLSLLQQKQVTAQDGGHPHQWQVQSYKKPTRCCYCGKYLIGLYRQGCQCVHCNKDIHQRCKQFLPICDAARAAEDTVQVLSEDVEGEAGQAEGEAVVHADSDEEEEWSSGDEDNANPPEKSGSKRQAIAVYDYKPGNEDELELSAGDVINIENFEGEVEWYQARNGDKTGVVPSNYIKFFEGDPRSQVMTLYEYVATKDDELSFPADELITLVEPVDENWCIGRYQGKQGIFPMSYVNEGFSHMHGVAPPPLTPSNTSATEDQISENVEEEKKESE